MSFTIPETVIAGSEVWYPAGGEVMERCGGVVSRLMRIAAVEVAPPADRAATVTVLFPSEMGTLALKLPLALGVAAPLMVRVAAGSPVVPETVMTGVLT